MFLTMRIEEMDKDEAKMATKIEQYNAAKRDQTDCLAWAALIGSPYSGGGGGVEELRSLSLGSVTVYHQYSNGAKNYHEIPDALVPHLCAAIKAKFSELVEDALNRQDVALKAVAEKAVKEYGEMLQEAGLAAERKSQQLVGSYGEASG
jgi:hypothetical protein